MWQKETKDSAIVRLALLLAIGTMPMATTLLVPRHILAQSATDAPSFSLPTTLENGTTVRIDGSSGLSTLNQNLKQSFEQQFSGTKVEVAANGTDAALKGLLDGTIDIAALGRGLTPQEQAQGLEQVRLHREKIAIIVGADNPFKGSLTARQFARIFRGQITDWSQLGGAKSKIRVIDRPTTSDTRNTFRNYPAFKSANFATGSTATQVADDNTAEIVKQLGNDGISYALANQVSQLPGVRVLQVHQTSPTDAKYPFSQPLVYAYKKSPSPGVAGFLGFAIAPPGQQAIEAARTAEAAAIAQGGLQALATTTTTSPTPEATTATTSPTPEATIAATDANATTAPSEPLANPTANENASVQREAPFWLLLPLLVIAVLGGLSYWWFLKRRPRAVEAADSPEEALSPATPAIAAGAGAAISSGFSDTGLTDGTRDNGEVAWEIEAPATVVNTPYPHLPEVHTVASNSESPKAEVSSATADNSEVPIVASDISNKDGEQPQVESNAEDLTSTGGAAIAAGAATWSAVGGTESNSEDSRNPIGNSNYSIWDSQESQLPVIETAATLPELADVGEQTTDVELPIIETAATLPDLPDVGEQTDVQLPIIETAATIPDLADIGEQTDVQLPIIETAATLPDLADVGEQTDVQLPIIETAATIPDLADIGEQTDVQLPIIETAATLPDLADVGEQTDVQLPIIETAATIPDLADIGEQTDVQLPIIETAATLPDLPDVPDVALDAVADEAESNEEETTEEIIEIVSNLPAQTTEEASNLQEDVSLTELGALAGGAGVAASAGIDDWANIYGSHEGSASDTTVNNVPVVEATATASPNANVEDTVILRSHTPKWAYVSWEISDNQKQALQDSGSPLTVRLSDVTGLDLSYQNPQLIQQYECDVTAHDCFVSIPVSDRDYIVEIGYITDGDRWVKIAHSEIVRVFSNSYIPGEETADSSQANVEDSISLTPRNAESAYVSWEISDNQKQALQGSGSSLALRLYDVSEVDLSYQSPQLIQQYECDATARDRFVAIPVSDRDYIAELGYITDGDRWVKIASSEIVHIFSNPYVPSEETTDSSEANVEDSISLTPQNSESVEACWQISDVNKQVLQEIGCPLSLRLYDVTDLDLSYQTPQFIQQYDCEVATQNCVVTIPVGDRDYIAEIGYASSGEHWVSIARSEIVRIFSHPPIDSAEHADLVDANDADIKTSMSLTPRTAKWAYVSWHLSDTQKQVLQDSGISQLAIRLYDVTDLDLSYQSPPLVQQYECDETARDRFVAIPVSDRDYITELGYVTDSDSWVSIVRSPTVRVFSRPYPDFWFVADAEIIIHGATEPDATVRIGGHTIKLKPDGTFHLRIPFSDSLIEYLMTATSATEEQTRTIHKKFSQDNLET
jgi:phosphate transport system substrate-binding protein